LIATLEPHPATPNDAVKSVTARLTRASDALSVAYVLEGDLDRLRIPALGSAGAAHRLWEHTCFEIFISRPGFSAYHELNFSPDGAWAAYAFERYRASAPPVRRLDPRVTVRHAEGKLELDALIALAPLAPEYVLGALALGVSAVIEDSGGALSYWALAHPAGKPDFHHPHAFALALK
jgi:hypothetical protein